jgi:hypothetical protein
VTVAPPLRLIGAGLGRTSTRSLKDALEILGFDKTYHMTDAYLHLERVRHWEDLVHGRPVDWAALFDGYQAVVDFPGAAVWRQLVSACPDAPVVLTVRDPEDWYDSVMATIYTERSLDELDLTNPRDRLHAWNQQHIWDGTLFQGRMRDRAFAVDCFRRHIAEVKATIPPARLLVLPVGSGWEPLCTFLELPVPSEPYPNRNSRQEFIDRAAGVAT